MDDLILKELAKEIVNKLKGKMISIETDMEEFLKTQISEENKKKALEQLYLFQLYSNAYLGPDPRGQKSIFVNAILVVNSKNDDELLDKIERLKEVTEFMKSIETHPFSAIERKIKDKKKI